MPRFLFATGIEGSYPVISDGHGGTERYDQMEASDHYRRWREDFALVRELGIDFLRYGPQLYLTLTGPGRFNWSFADETFAEIRRLGITPIVDLCHFGVPDCTHPRKAAYRASAGSVLDLTGVFWSAGKDRKRGGRWRSSPG